MNRRKIKKIEREREREKINSFIKIDHYSVVAKKPTGGRKGKDKY